MIWPQQYHKEKQEEVSPAEAWAEGSLVERLCEVVIWMSGSADFAPEGVAGKAWPSARAVLFEGLNSLKSPTQPVEAPGEQPQIRTWNDKPISMEGTSATAPAVMWPEAHAPQPEAPAAEQWHVEDNGQLLRNYRVGRRGVPVVFDFWFEREAKEAADYLNSLTQQRVLDVNPESPTDAKGGVGETEQWRQMVEQAVPWVWYASKQWPDFDETDAAMKAWLAAAEVLLPQPIDPRSEAR